MLAMMSELEGSGGVVAEGATKIALESLQTATECLNTEETFHEAVELTPVPNSSTISRRDILSRQSHSLSSLHNPSRDCDHKQG